MNAKMTQIQQIRATALHEAIALREQRADIDVFAVADEIATYIKFGKVDRSHTNMAARMLRGFK